MKQLDEKTLLDRKKQGLFSWINFSKGAYILCIDENSNLLSFLDSSFNVKNISSSFFDDVEGKYDYILWRRFDNNSHKMDHILNKINSLLTDNGVAYLGFINKYSIRRECGDTNYYGKYSKKNIENIFKRMSYNFIRIFSIFPDLYYPQFIISNDFYPNENMLVRYFPIYNDPKDIDIDERAIVDYLISEKKLHDYANGYLVEFRKNNNNTTNCQYITLSMDRDNENACNTIVSADCVIKKYPFYPPEKKIEALKDNEMHLINHKVPIIKSAQDKFYKVKFYNADILTTKLHDLLMDDINNFYILFDRYRDIIYSSSDIVKIDNSVPVLKRCYFDLVPLNCLWLNDDFMFIDQEFYTENMSANIVIWRAIKILYLSYPDISNYVLEKDLLARYGMDEQISRQYGLIANSIIDKIRNNDLLKDFYSKHTISVTNLKRNADKSNNNRKLLLMKKIKNSNNKKYNIGYVAGVFDLFHVGHLNILKKAKEQCNHLIVGVVSDRGVTELKGVELFIPFEERIEIVRSCKYVDEAHEIPFEHPTTIDAFNMYHFDVQFSGDDYINDPGWLYMKDFLEKNGSEMVFLPYTKDTSSTKIKESINSKGIKK